MEIPDLKKLTSEQRVEAGKLLNKASTNLFFIGLKFMAGMFLANITTTFIGFKFLKDVDQDQLIGYTMVCVCLNSFFMIRYLNRKVKENENWLKSKIKEILNKNPQ